MSAVPLSNMKASQRLTRAALALSLALPLAGCDTLTLGIAAGGDSLENLMADKNCSQVPRFVPPQPVKVQSVLLGSYVDHDKVRDYSLLPINVLGRSEDDEYVETNTYAMLGGLLQQGWRFLEIESPGRDGKAMNQFLELGGDRQMKYLRVSIATRGDTACEGFEHAVRAMGSEMFQKQLLGDVPPGKCVATLPEARATSNYELRVVDLPDDRTFKPEFSEQPGLWQIVDRQTGVIYAQLVRRMNIRSRCPSVEVRRQFLDVLQVTRTNDSD